MSLITIQTENAEITNLLKSLLERIKGVKIISDSDSKEVIGYKMDGSPIFADEYRKEIQQRIEDIESGKRQTYSTNEVVSAIQNNL